MPTSKKKNEELRKEIDDLKSKYETMNTVLHDLCKFAIELKKNPVLKAPKGGLI